MRRVMILSVLIIFAFVLAVAAADLGELAKKEKARREALEKQGKKAKVLTNADVPNIKSQLAIERTSDQTQPAEDTSVSSDQPQTGEANAQTQEAPKEDAAERARQEQIEQIEQQISNLQAQKDAVQQQVDQARDAVGQGGVYHSANPGNQYQTINQGEARLQELEKQIQALRQQEAQLQQENE